MPQLYTKQDLYAAYAKHHRLGLDDHEPGSCDLCAVCDEINRISSYLERQEDGSLAGPKLKRHRQKSAKPH